MDKDNATEHIEPSASIPQQENPPIDGLPPLPKLSSANSPSAIDALEDETSKTRHAHLDKQTSDKIELPSGNVDGTSDSNGIKEQATDTLPNDPTAENEKENKADDIERIYTAPHLPIQHEISTFEDEQSLSYSKLAEKETTGEPYTQTEEDDDDAEETQALMDPNHPLMKRVQDALLTQLASQNQKLDLQLLEKEESVKSIVKKRQDIGVELYSIQQHLARLQALLEGTEESCSSMRNLKVESERRLSLVMGNFKEHLAKYNNHSKNLQQHKQELQKMSTNLKQVEMYSEEVASKIKLTKRTTLKSEEDILKQEIEKKRQDYFIDKLTDQLKRLQERRALYETQLLAQQRETKAAVETLQDANAEMEVIEYEKKQLLHQWKSSIIGLQRREEVIHQINDGIQKNKSTIANLEGEISKFKQTLKKSSQESESLTILVNKLEGEIDYLKRQMSSMNDQKDKLKESYALYSKSLAQTEMDLAQIMQERQALQLEVNAIQKAIQQTITSTQKIDTQIKEHLQSQTTYEKGTSITKKQSRILTQTLHNQESTIAVVQNEISMLKLESLNVSSRVRDSKAALDALDTEIVTCNSLIEKFEGEIKKRNDELSKKQGDMDALNKKFDILSGKNQDVSMGPLEATIHNLTRAIEAKDKEGAQLSQFWIKSQNELVAWGKKSLEIGDNVQDLKMKLAVLERRKLVVQNQYDGELNEIKNYQRSIRQLQNDLVKINTLVSKHANIQTKLEENNLGLELEFRGKLKDAELESIHLESQVEKLNSEKEKALQGLIESERQLMLWEKKLQLLKETQAALDPNIGATEIRDMNSEIHRMKLRYDSMLKVQEKMIVEMERSVYRRESISIRTKAKGTGIGQMSLQKMIADLTKKIRTTSLDLMECDQDIESMHKAKENMMDQIESSSESVRLLENKERDILYEMEQTSQEKSVEFLLTLLYQKKGKFYEKLEKGEYTFLLRDSIGRKIESKRQGDKLVKLNELLISLQGHSSEHVFQLVSKLKPLLIA